MSKPTYASIAATTVARPRPTTATVGPATVAKAIASSYDKFKKISTKTIMDDYGYLKKIHRLKRLSDGEIHTEIHRGFSKLIKECCDEDDFNYYCTCVLCTGKVPEDAKLNQARDDEWCPFDFGNYILESSSYCFANRRTNEYVVHAYNECPCLTCRLLCAFHKY